MSPRGLRLLLAMEVGDASPYWRAAIELLVDFGVCITLLTLRRGGRLDRHLAALKERTVNLDVGGSKDYPGAVLSLARHLREQRYDLVHAHEPLAAAIAGVGTRIARCHTPLIYHRHHLTTTGVQRSLSFAAARMGHLTLAVSEAARRASLVEDRPGRTAVVHNGVPSPPVGDSHGQDPRWRLGLASGDRMILSVARFRPEKGHADLIRAFRLLERDSETEAHLVLVGDGPSWPEIERAARATGSGRVHLPGQQRDVGAWYAAADVVAVPSLHESFGLVAAEAMSCGRPVVATRVGGLSEVIEHGRSGLLVPPRDPEALAAGLRTVLLEPERARRLGQAARRRYEAMFTPEKMVAGWLEQYEAVLLDTIGAPGRL